MASFVWTSDEADPCKGADKWEIGSATPKNIRPMPIPAENSMHNQEKKENSGFSSSFPKRMSPSFPRHKMTRKRKKKATQRMYTQLNELNIYSFTLLKTASVRSGKKIQLMTTIPMNKILGRTILACKLFFGIFKEKPPFQNKNERYEQIKYTI